jgi:hypothetical protein
MSFQMAGFSTLAHSVLTLSKIYILDSSENQLNIDIGKNAAIKAGNDIDQGVRVLDFRLVKAKLIL